MLGQDATDAERVELRERLGLNEPAVVQFGHFVANAAQGNFGISLRQSEPVSSLLKSRLPATLELSLVAAVLALVVGVPLGVYTALKRNSMLSQLLLAGSLLGVSLPTFLIGILLILVFSVQLGWLPSYGRGETVSLGWWSSGLFTADGWKHLILPSITLSLFQMTLVLRLVRSEMLEVLRSDYIKFARARAQAPRHPLRPRAQEHDGARHHHHRPAAGRHHRLRHRHGNRVPVAGHGPAVHPGRAIRRRAGHGRLSVPDRAGLRGDQPDRRSSVFRRGPAPARRDDPRRGSLMRAVLKRWWDSDLAWAWRRAPVAIAATILLALLLIGSFGAGWVAPHNPFDLTKVELLDALLPPAWQANGQPTYLLGTDSQGRDLYSAILYGTRVSLLIGLAAVALSMVIGIVLGLVSGYAGGRIDAFIMRVADVQLSFPAILIALLIDGVARAAVPRELHEVIAFPVLVGAIALAGWPQYARTVRGSTLVEKNREYVQAARVIGVASPVIMFRHVLPNVLGPVLVLATVHLATAIITEATLSFLGVGVPPTSPSLGTLIRIGNDFLFSGEWWIVIFPGLALVLLVLSVNLLGDWLRDALNPRLM